MVNQKNSVLLQLLYIQYFYFTEEIDYTEEIDHTNAADWYTQLFFSLLLQHTDFVHLLPLFGIIVLSLLYYPTRDLHSPMKGVHSCIKRDGPQVHGSLLHLYPQSPYIIVRNNNRDDQSVKL